MWERLWRWLLSPSSGRPDSLDGDFTDTPGKAAADGLLTGDSQAPGSKIPPGS